MTIPKRLAALDVNQHRGGTPAPKLVKILSCFTDSSPRRVLIGADRDPTVRRFSLAGQRGKSESWRVLVGCRFTNYAHETAV
jgi:hypothetical protein